MASVPPTAGAGAARQTTPPNQSILSRHLLQVVDRVPETRGLGVVLIDFGRMQRVRTPPSGTATVVFERRMKPVAVPLMLARPGASATQRAQAPQRQRTATASPASEWINLGLNCGGHRPVRGFRRALTTALDLQGGRRVPGVVINRVVRQRLMDGVGGVIGLFASSYSGALGEAGSGFWDLVVWITEETGRQS